jgi:hypothetical protein
VSQNLAQSNTATVTVKGDVKQGGEVTVIQVNNADQIAVPITVNIKDIEINPAVAWNGGQAATNGGENSK